MGEKFDWSWFINNLWERENALGLAGKEGKGGYKDGRYYPYHATNGWDVGPGFDMKYQSDAFKQKAYKEGYSKEELDDSIKARYIKELPFIEQRIIKEGGDPLNVPNEVIGGLLDIFHTRNNGLYSEFPKLWKAVALGDYEGMQRESRTGYYEENKPRTPEFWHYDDGRWEFRKDNYFKEPSTNSSYTPAFDYSEKRDAIQPLNPYTKRMEDIVVQEEGPYRENYGVTSSEKRAEQIRAAVKAKHDYEKIMKATNLKSTATEFKPKFTFDTGGFLQPKDAWDALSMEAKAEMMKVAINHGIYNIDDIRKKYNEFAEGGSKGEAEEVNTEKNYIYTMERVAEENYKKWGFSNPDEALLHALNDNTYNYRGYYDRYPQSKANADTHWSDEFKTVYHPTFSNESIYSGKVSQYNPQGIVGGFWGNDTFIPSIQQVMEESKIPLLEYLTNEYKNGGGIHIAPSKKGTFTAAASKHGKSVQAFASQVLAHKENYSPAMVKKANFARNAKKFKHGEGGNLFYPGGYVRESNDNPIAFDDEGNLTDQVTREKGTMMLPEITVTGRDLTKPYYSSYDSSTKPYIELFSALSKGFQPLSLSQHVGAAFDAAQGKRGYFDSLFNGNSGFFTDKYEKEHPLVSAIGNMAGDVIGFPLLGNASSYTLKNPLKTTSSTVKSFTGAANPIPVSETDMVKHSITDQGTIGLLEETIKNAELGKKDVLSWIASPFYKARWQRYTSKDNVNRIIERQRELIEQPFDYSKSARDLAKESMIDIPDNNLVLGTTKLNPFEELEIGGENIKNFNTGTNVKIASDAGKEARKTAISELMHHTSGNSIGYPTEGDFEVILGDLFSPVGLKYPKDRTTIIPIGDLWQNFMVRQNEMLLPKQSVFSLAVENDPKFAIKGLLQKGYTPEEASVIMDRATYMLDIQEQMEHLKSMFISDIVPKISNPNSAEEIERYITMHPELIYDDPHLNTLVTMLRPGSIKSYAKYLAEALSTLPIINQISQGDKKD